VSRLGAARFAQYAYPPNELGYCGPPGARAMLDADATRELERRARHFEGAWCYLELLAETADVADPLDPDVVDAYWIGGDLLDQVDPAALVGRLTDRFRGQSGGSWREAAARATPHHSFQVFEVYPWLGLLREGRPPGPAVRVLDRCRIRVGEVLEVAGERVTVCSRGLAWDGTRLTRAGSATESARWSVGGRALVERPQVGALVALHWDWVCEEITPDQAARIEHLERRTRAGAQAP
jgi:hypothetical protein